MKADNIFNKVFLSKTRSDYLKPLLNKLRSPNKHIHITGMEDRGRHFFLSHLSHLTNNILYIVNSKEEAQRACTELSFFLNKNVHYLSGKFLSPNKPIYSSSAKYELSRTGWLHNCKGAGIMVSEINNLFAKVIPQNIFFQTFINLSAGDRISRTDFISNLNCYGYQKTDFVQKISEFSTRGSIIDVYSPQYEHPVRIELLGNTIESIRYFSIMDQRTLSKTGSATIIPASEIVTTGSFVQDAIANIRQHSRNNEIRTTLKNSLINDLENNIRNSWTELMAPFFYHKLDTVFDHLNNETILVFKDFDYACESADKIKTELNESLTELNNKYKFLPGFHPLFIDKSEFQDILRDYPAIYLTDSPYSDNEFINLNCFKPVNFSNVTNEETSPFDGLINKTGTWSKNKYSVHYICSSEKEREKITSLMNDRGLSRIEITMGNLEHGFIADDLKLVLITENDVYREKTRRKYDNASDVSSAFITSFSELSEGDCIVHRDFGIGIYRGLAELKIRSQKGDFLICEYKDGDRIYVPVDRLNIIQRYIGNGTTPKICRLGDPAWSRTVKRVHKAVENIAKDLLELYAERKVHEGFRFSKSDTMYEQFENTFEYDETRDQSKAIDDVIADMETGKCMDRLICGDVGFGKTEVALRAAFKASMDGKQVVIIVPTTLLCLQHFETFRSRLHNYPLKVEMLSRFKTSFQAGDIIKRVKRGEIDILIGTHKLLSGKIEFKDLGLIIIDEEHKFGVKQKESIRKIKHNVDVLSLSATPIPRTLQMSLVNIRDISLINTPPEGRKEIETFIYQFNEEIIRQAVTKELDRGGAVFFIHNRIEDIDNIAGKISSIIPDVRYLVTHGRMRETVLENSIQKLRNGDIDLLITTTIVESGIHIPRANTIIVNEANKFGLADLYQLRGRVGRSDRKAYAYFLVESNKILTDVAKKRLKAISEINELGSGFKLALSDLEIRGAGNLFGTDQSGHINDIGLEMYLDMLNKEIQAISGQEVADDYEPEIKTFLPSYIPKEYIGDNSERLLFYKRLSSCLTSNELSDISNELTDRFGRMPEPLANLISLINTKLDMKKINIKKLDHRKNSFTFKFNKNSDIFEMFKPSGIYRKTTGQFTSIEDIQESIIDISNKYKTYKNLESEIAH